MSGSHWLIFRDEQGWGCTGCEYSAQELDLDAFGEAHGRTDDDQPF